jgi:hypothetical protein
MKLSVLERIQLLNLLPAEGSIVTLRLISELRLELGFSEKEIKTAEIKQDSQSGRITWKPDAAVIKDVKIGDAAKAVVVDALKRMDKELKLTMLHVPLWDKFMA